MFYSIEINDVLVPANVSWQYFYFVFRIFKFAECLVFDRVLRIYARFQFVKHLEMMNVSTSLQTLHHFEPDHVLGLITLNSVQGGLT